MKEKIKKLKTFIIKNTKWIILSASLISLLIIIKDVINEEIVETDTKGYKIISTYLISNNVTPIAKTITKFGGTFWLIVLSIVLFLIIKNKKIGKSIFLNLGCSALTNFTLKQIIQRPRPTEYRIIDESGYSLPSGHSMVSMSFYGYLIYLIIKKIKNKYLKISLVTLLTILIISIGISRIYLGVHYTSDVLAGFLVAISYLIIYINIIKNFIEDKE